MEFVKDLKWKEGMDVNDLVSSLGKVGFQSVELKKAQESFRFTFVRRTTPF